MIVSILSGAAVAVIGGLGLDRARRLLSRRKSPEAARARFNAKLRREAKSALKRRRALERVSRTVSRTAENRAQLSETHRHD